MREERRLRVFENWVLRRMFGHKRDEVILNMRWIFRKLEGVVGTGWSYLRIGTGGGHLWVR